MKKLSSFLLVLLLIFSFKESTKNPEQITSKKANEFAIVNFYKRCCSLRYFCTNRIKGLTLKETTKEVIQKKLPELGGTGGVIALDKKGNISMEYNTPGMDRASMNDKGELYAGIYKDE